MIRQHLGYLEKEMGIRSKFLAVVEGVTKVVVNQLDPVGQMTMKEAQELIVSGDTDKITLAQAERVYAVTSQMAMSASLLSRSAGSPFGGQGIPDGYEPITDPEEIRRIAEKQGVDPSQVAGAFRQKALQTVNGPVNWEDAPKDKDGNLDPAWVEENCACPEHEAQRASRKESVNANAKPTAGPYL